MSLLVFIVIGLIAGLLARAVVPGRQPMGLLTTTLLGIGGSLLGGIIGSVFSGGSLFVLRPSGLILSVVGAVLVLLLFGYAGKRRVTA